MTEEFVWEPVNYKMCSATRHDKSNDDEQLQEQDYLPFNDLSFILIFPRNE